MMDFITTALKNKLGLILIPIEGIYRVNNYKNSYMLNSFFMRSWVGLEDGA